MSNSSSQLAVVGAVLALVMVIGAWLASSWRKYKLKRDSSKAAKNGLKAEKEAEKLLKKLGYTLLQRKPPASYWAVVDGEPVNVSLSGDLLVEIKGKTLLAEVKTGKAVKLDHEGTRRQLLEYQLAFGVDGLLLVDMEAKAVRTVRFPAPKPAAKSAAAAKNKKALRWLAIAAAAGLGLWLVTRLMSRSDTTHAPALVPSEQPHAEHAGGEGEEFDPLEAEHEARSDEPGSEHDPLKAERASRKSKGEEFDPLEAQREARKPSWWN